MVHQSKPKAPQVGRVIIKQGMMRQMSGGGTEKLQTLEITRRWHLKKQ